MFTLISDREAAEIHSLIVSICDGYLGFWRFWPKKKFWFV